MSNASLELGGGKWGTKDGNLLGYASSTSSSKFVPREFTFTRGSDIAATRINSSGLIEKGRENLLENSVWDGVTTDTKPTGWTFQFVSGTGTFDVTATEGQIRFQTLDASSRAFIYSPTITTNGIVVASVYVDEVTTAMPLSDLLTRTANATALFAYEDGVQINYYSDNVQAGKRYSVVFNKTASTNFRFGVGVSSATLGDVVLSRPQIEVGLVATEWITSPIGSTGKAGVLDNLPRIDYAGGTGSLLLEPSRTNLVTQSEYFDDAAWVSNYTLTSNYTTSPDGGMNAYRVQVGTVNGYLREQISVSSSTDYVFSFYAKRGSATEMKYRVYDFTNTVNIVTNTSYYSQTSASDWVRIEVPFTTTATTASIGVYIDSDGQGNGDFLIWGAQLEQGSYPTSYIPTYGTSVTRDRDAINEFTLPSSIEGDCTIFLDTRDFLAIHSYITFKAADGTNTYSFYSFSNHYDVYNGSAFIVDSSADATGKIALKQSGSSVKIFVNGQDKTKSGATANTIGIAKILVSQSSAQNNIVALKQMQLFPTALTDKELVDLTSPYSTYQELVTAEGLTWESPTCTTNSITELQSI